MKKIISIVLVCILIISCCACGGNSKAKIAVPNDPTNEARALRLLEAQGIIKLSSDAGDLATKKDIVENPYNIEIYEVEAAQIPNVLKDVKYAVINSNYAIEAGLTPFVTEGTDISYPNVICVKEGNENSDEAQALYAAIHSKQVAQYINDTYKGAIVCDLVFNENVEDGDGYNPNVDYAGLNGKTIKIACSPTPHADILKKAKEILAAKGITLDIVVCTDYITPNTMLENGDVFANYFAHIPYQEQFNAENGTHINWILEVHHEPMGVYSSEFANWDGLKN